MQDDNNKTVGRRDALALLSLGTAGLVACGDADPLPDSGVADADVDTGGALDVGPDADASLDAGSDGAMDADAGPAGTTLTPDDFGDAGCVLAPAQTAGPFYYPVELDRADIREGKPGALLRFGVRVVDADCDPVEGAVVHLWHCDALGFYAGFPTADPDLPPPGGLSPDESEIFCRGIQLTNADGICEFVTIYPGWYSVRTAHMHLRVIMGDTTFVTTQAYFDDDYTDAVYGTEPYLSRPDRMVFNDGDGGYNATTETDVRADGDGHLGTVTLSVNV